MAEKITKNKINEIKNKSVLVVGDNPSENGLSSDQIKKAIVDPVLEVIDEVNRIVDEVNSETGSTIDKAEYVSNKIKEWYELNNEHQYPNAQLVKQSLDAKINSNNIADNLETEEKGKVLDASQGKILNDKINKKVDLIQGNENANKVAVTNSNGNVYFAKTLPKGNMPEITIDMLPSGAGIIADVAQELKATGGNVTGDDIKQRLQMFDELESNVDEKLEEVLEIVDKVDDVLKAEVICKHAIEITGNTGDEHGLAIEDQQMLLKKIQGQSLFVNQLVEDKTYTNSDVTDIKQQLDFVVQSYTYNNEYVTLIPYRSYPLNSTNLKLEGIVTLPDNMNTLTLKHSGSDSDINFAYLRELKSHSNHKALYSLVLKTCNINVINGVNVDNIMVIDLTQMFGAGKEPTTVEEFYSKYGNGYIPYNEGTFKHSQCNLISTGRNLWDEQWFKGHWSEVGTAVQGTNYISSKNYIPTLPNTNYASNHMYYWCFFDKDKNFIKRDNGMSITTPSNCYYVQCSAIDSYGTNYNNDIIVNFGATALEYEPYKEEVFVVNEELKAFDYIQDDKLVNASREMVVDTNSIIEVTGYGYENITYFKIDKPLDFIGRGNIGGGVICSKYQLGIGGNWDDVNKIGLLFLSADHYNFWFGFPKGTTLEQAKSELSGVKLVYELATPTITDLDIAGGYAVYKGGYQIQDGEVPYILTKEYSMSVKAQILANVEIDREQQEQLNELKEKINEAVSTSDSAYDLADEALGKATVNEQGLNVLERKVTNESSRVDVLYDFMADITSTVDNKADLDDVITKDKIQYGIINGDNIVGLTQTIDLSQFKYWKGIINPPSQTYNFTLHYLYDGDVEHETYSFSNPIIEYINGTLLIQANEANRTFLLTSKSFNIEMVASSDSDAFSIYWKGEK